MSDKDLNQLGLLYLVGLSRAISSRIRLQKLVCLNRFENGEQSPFTFAFKSHYYGPYSEDLRSATDALVRHGLVKEDVQLLGDTRYSYSYKLTDAGKKELDLHAADEGIKAALAPIHATVSKYGSLSTELVVQKAKEVSGLPSIQ